MSRIRHEREAGIDENLVYPTTAVSRLLPNLRQDRGAKPAWR